MHKHDCPLCDQDGYECDDYGCEELTSNVCKDCLEDIEDDEPEKGNS
jgi:hypothetical protein